jgi:dihydroorotate dehydrogenase
MLRALPPETAHRAALCALEAARIAGFLRRPTRAPFANPHTAMGLCFPNRLGLAAGMDKNATHLRALDALGFGFIEIGTITPRAQAGNRRPRVFRLPEENALINRMGFPNDGARQAAHNIKRAGKRAAIIGISIGRGAQTASERAVRDYLDCLEALFDCGDYFAINISSPNTANLRDLHKPPALRELLSNLIARRDALAKKIFSPPANALLSSTQENPAGDKKPPPVLLKISPDLEDEEIITVAKTAADCGIDGLIAANTTIARPPRIAALRNGGESGGLSGRPLAARANETLRILRRNLPEDVALIGVGGILNAADAVEKIAAGADLLQIYTGLAYRGPKLIREILRALD